MFKRFVKFVIMKEDAIRVIDAISTFGAITIVNMKEGRSYVVSLNCHQDDLQQCLDSIMELSRNGVIIRRLNVKMKAL